jgi:hypothetical protein
MQPMQLNAVVMETEMWSASKKYPKQLSIFKITSAKRQSKGFLKNIYVLIKLHKYMY